ncbi:MAG: ExeA family protein [Thermoanaerobaculia bacterium]
MTATSTHNVDTEPKKGALAMDLAFFGLREPPFNPTPDPRFLHLTPAHQEALAQLLYGVQQRKGFILLTGEVGTGKTTLLHAMLDRLDDTTAVAFVTNSMLGFEGVLEYMLEDLGIAKPLEMSLAQRLFALQSFLIERQRAGQNTVLILDEAQNLDPQTLEQIRLLSNFEAKSEKILQILLVGQPELRTRLDSPELRQLKQRIGLRCRIPSLGPAQVPDYVRTRLRIAGTHDLGLFSPEAIARIADYSGGVPRLVNMVCDHCLLFAYADQVRRIDRPIVEEAIQYLEEGEQPRRRSRSILRSWRTPSIRWIVAASATTVGLAVLSAAHPATLWRTIGLVASSLSDFARSALALLLQ